ncbi:MAG TPA: coproporphyrinogen-III oxidase family protein [Spirochaetota bacterium]|nr:coproporphyrinogen-III oxidase family protein [Spirochaetota bacterium]
MNVGVYIHVPFCRSKCDYCSFYSVPVGMFSDGDRRKLFGRYVDRLIDEMRGRSRDTAAFSFDTIYFGGGTPSLLGAPLVARVIETVRSCFSRTGPDCEITLECNPEDFSVTSIGEYRSAGVNRVVLGVQTLDAHLRGVIGRRSKAPDTKMLNAFFAMSGIAHCVDIITGIPGQDKGGLNRELERLLAYRPEHVSAYILSIDKNTPLSRRMAETHELSLEQRRRFEDLMAVMEKRGYTHYEVSNFCVPGFESRHNMKYWTFAPYIGYGPGAHSFYGLQRLYSTQTVEEYLEGPSIAPVLDERGKGAAAEEFLLTGLRLRRGITRSAFETATGSRMPDALIGEFDRLAKEGLALVEGAGGDVRFSFSIEGLFHMDGLVARLAARL